MDLNNLPDRDKELKRYNEHNNDVNNAGYQQFVMPIVDAVAKQFTSNHQGLDFGAGPGPVVAKLLHDKQYDFVLYDPFFYDYPHLLTKTYDYIVACEVIEHFHNPYKEFVLLKNLLKPNGKLFCMTSIYNQDINFSTWYYKNDPTHVFIYQQETIFYIREHFGFKDVEILNNMIIFST